MRLISDAGTYTDQDRAIAAEILAEVAPVDVLRLYQFSDVEFAKLVIEFVREVGATLLSGGVMYLVGRRHGKSHVEFKREEADGSVTTAVLDTADPKIVHAAAQQLDQIDQTATPLVFNPETDRWEPR